MKVRLIAALALALTGSAWADDEHAGRPHTHWWLELPELNLTWSAGATLTASSFDDWSFASDSFGNDGSYTSSSEDRSDVGYRVHGGLDFLKYFGVEFGWSDLGDASFRAQSNGTGSIWDAGTVTESMGADAADVTLIGRLDLGVDTAVTARVGMLRWEVDRRLTGTYLGGPYDARESDKGSDLQYGVAAEYAGLKPLRFVLGYSRAELDVDTGVGKPVTLSSFWISAAYLFQ